MIVKKIINKPPRIKRIGWLAISSVGSTFYSMASVSSVKIYNWLEYYHVEVCTQIYRVFLVVPNTCKSISDIILHEINLNIFTTNLKRHHYILTSEKNNDYDTKVSVAHSKHIYSQIRFIVSQLERKKLADSPSLFWNRKHAWRVTRFCWLRTICELWILYLMCTR